MSGREGVLAVAVVVRGNVGGFGVVGVGGGGWQSRDRGGGLLLGRGFRWRGDPLGKELPCHGEGVVDVHEGVCHVHGSSAIRKSQRINPCCNSNLNELIPWLFFGALLFLPLSPDERSRELGDPPGLREPVPGPEGRPVRLQPDPCPCDGHRWKDDVLVGSQGPYLCQFNPPTSGWEKGVRGCEVDAAAAASGHLLLK